MKLIVIVILVVFPISVTYAHPQNKEPNVIEKALRAMFPSSKPKITTQRKPRRIVRHRFITASPTPLHPYGYLYVAVEPSWMARYWEQEAAWDYYIPEDDLIRFQDGQYIVPIVVYRHHEDMANSHRRTSSAIPKPE